MTRCMHASILIFAKRTRIAGTIEQEKPGVVRVYGRFDGNAVNFIESRLEDRSVRIDSKGD